METSDSLVILYLMVFRLAIITAGIVSIVLGYKLFVKGVFTDGSEGTGIEAGVGSLKLTMRNAAPGSVFAFFGVFLISVMLIQNPPGLDKQNGIVKLRGESDGQSKAPAEPKPTLEADVRDLIKSVVTYENGFQSLARHLARFSNIQAWIYFEDSRLDEALPLADIGVRLAPDEAEYLDTQGRILFALKRYEEAIDVMQRAAEIDPQHNSTLEEFRRNQP